MNKTKIIVAFFLLLTVVVQAQDKCLNEVKNVYQSWTKQVNDSRENNVYLKYSMEIITGEGEQLKNNRSTVELISNQESSFFSSADLKVYQDKSHTVSILSDKKIIVINNVVGENYKKEKLGQFEFLQEELFNQLETKECEIVSINGKEYKKVTLKTTTAGAKEFKMETIQFLLDKERNIVKEIQVSYVEGHRFHSMKMNIIKQDLNYSKNNLTKKVLSNVLTTSGELIGKYASYQLIDNRN